MLIAWKIIFYISKNNLNTFFFYRYFLFSPSLALEIMTKNKELSWKFSRKICISKRSTLINIDTNTYPKIITSFFSVFGSLREVWFLIKLSSDVICIIITFYVHHCYGKHASKARSLVPLDHSWPFRPLWARIPSLHLQFADLKSINTSISLSVKSCFSIPKSLSFKIQSLVFL